MVRAVLLLCLCCVTLQASARVPAGYPQRYAATIAAAEKEGKLVVYAALDRSAIAPLIDDFQAMYPGITVEYRDMNSADLYAQFVRETRSGTRSADIVWSSAMDLQFKLVNDGYAQAYKSPEVTNLPAWAVWRNEAFGTTYEPVAFAYNKRLLADHEAPQTHEDFARLLSANPKRFRGKVATYDIERAGLGFIFAAEDARTWRDVRELLKAFGSLAPRFSASTEEMLERLASGDEAIAYNLVGSYTRRKARGDASIGYVYPKDYTLVISRIIFIPRSAPHFNAARLWLDYVLSKRGQSILADKCDLFALRADVDGEATASTLTRTLGGALKPIPVGPSLIIYLDKARREEFLKQWKEDVGKD